MTAQAKFTGTMSVPLMIAMLGFKASSSRFGGIRWMRITPGPSGFSVVCRTSVKVSSMYARIRRTDLVLRNSFGTGIIRLLLRSLSESMVYYSI